MNKNTIQLIIGLAMIALGTTGIVACLHQARKIQVSAASRIEKHVDWVCELWEEVMAMSWYKNASKKQKAGIDKMFTDEVNRIRNQ